MDATVSIRRAGIDDAESIGRFQTQAWDQTYRGLVPDEHLDGTTWRDRAHRWRGRICAGERAVWLVHAGEHLVGVASTAVTPTGRPDLPELELASIYVHADWHGRGVGPLHLDRAIGPGGAHLWVFDANARAQRFYARHGFVATGERQTDPGTGLGETRWLRRTAPDRDAGAERPTGPLRRLGGSAPCE